MAKVRITAVVEYDIDDDPKMRRFYYETEDINECVKIDDAQFKEYPDLIAGMYAEDIRVVSVELVQ
jgi:hypothetical protein